MWPVVIPLTRLLASLLLAAAVPTAAQATAAAFDTLWHSTSLRDQLGSRDSVQILALAQLRKELPEGDAYRRAMLRYLECTSQPGAPAEAYALATKWVQTANQAGHELSERVMANLCRQQLFEFTTSDTSLVPEADQLVAQATELGDPLWLGRALEYRGSTHSVAGAHVHALQDLLRATQVYTDAGLTQYADNNLLALGIAYRRMDDPINATLFLQRALSNAQSLEAWQNVLAAQLQLGYLHEDQGRLTAAEVQFREALRTANDHRERSFTATAELALAHVHLLRREFGPARALLDQAEQHKREAGDASERLTLVFYRGAVLVGLGQPEAGVRLISRAIDGWSQSDQPRYLAEALADRARAYETLGRTDAALRDYKRLLEVRQRLHANMLNQQGQWAREQFATSERQAENVRLQATQQAQAAQLVAAQQARRWQGVALLASALLLAALGTLLWRQYLLSRQLRALTVTDPLTRVLNRRGIEIQASQSLAQARRNHAPTCVLIFDIDHFKRVNDEQGHATGDVVLTRVAAVARAALRPYDLIGRVGGEEFLVVLPGTDLATGRLVAERVRQQVQASPWDDLHPDLRITLSWGLTGVRDDEQDLATPLRRADVALYQAKHAGRNRGESVI